MALSQQDLGRDINFLVKILQDFTSNVKMQNSSTLDYKSVVDMLLKAVNENGIDQRHFSSLMKKFVANSSGWNVQTSNIIRVFDELKHDKIDMQTIAKLMAPDQLGSTITQALAKLKALPVGLNTKENLSLLSKAIVKGNKDYSTTGFGRVSAEFYRNATNKQIKALAGISRDIKEQSLLNKKSSVLGDIIKGGVLGAVGTASDVLMQNAGFGELPGKFMTMFNSAKELWNAMKEKSMEADLERNAMLLGAAKEGEAAYSELIARNEESQKAIIEAEAIKAEQENSIMAKMEDALSKTMFTDKQKAKMMEKVKNNTLDEKDINKIMTDWKKNMGSDFNADAAKMMNESAASLLAGMDDLKDITKNIDKSKATHNAELEKENQTLIRISETRKELDKLMEKELEAQFKAVEKRIKKVSKDKDIQDAARESAHKQITEEVRKKYGVSDAEENNVFSDTRRRATENLKQQGKSDTEIESALQSDSMKSALDYQKDLNESLAKLSPIFRREAEALAQSQQSEPRRQIIPVSSRANRVTRRRNPTINPIAPVSTPNIAANLASAIAQPANLPATSTGQVGPSPTPPAGPQAQPVAKVKQAPRPQALVNMSTTNNHLKGIFDLMKKVYGTDGKRLAENIADRIANKTLTVNVKNWPRGGNGGSNNTNTSPTPPPTVPQGH